MPTEHLPERVDFRRSAARQARFAGDIPLARLHQLANRLAGTQGQVRLEVAFFQDEERRSVAEGTIQARLPVTCERCLETMALPLTVDFHLVAVWSDDEAAHLPKALDPWVVGEEPFALADLVEEELLLAMPLVCLHETDCVPAVRRSDDRPMSEEASAPVRSNPFQALEALRKKP